MCLCASVKKEPNASIKILCAYVTKEPMYLRQELKCLCASVYKKGKKVQKKWGRNIFVK